MALVTEDGTGLANAESYCSVSDANAYHRAQGNDAWADLETGRKEILLRRATGYMALYSARWSGARAGSTQALDWPRTEATAYGLGVPEDAVPPNVASACALLAFKADTGPLAPEVKPQKLRTKVGPLETEYAEQGSPLRMFPDVGALLAPYLTAVGAFSIPLRRV